MEFFLFPKRSYYLTQGYGPNSYSHKGRYALDVSAAGGGYKECYAPFSGHVAKVFTSPKEAYSIWLVSDEKVICANNKAYYAVMMLTHPEGIKNYKVGDTFKQGDYLFNDGSTGYATGAHLDIEIAIYDRKEDIKVGFTYTSAGTYGLVNATDPCKYLVLRNDVVVLNDVYDGKTYYIKKEYEVDDIRYDVGRYRCLANIRVRTGPGVDYTQKKVEDLSADGKRNATSQNPLSLAYYKKGTIFDALEIYIKENEVWAKTYSGYVNIIYFDEENCERI